MATLIENPVLKDYQNYIKDICKERGWDKNSHLELFLLFSEEIGELARAIRDHEGLYVEKNRTRNKAELESEFADVFAYLLDLANYFDIDMETAFRNKEKKNAKRVWSSK